jgi:hypothetical protein
MGSKKANSRGEIAKKAEIRLFYPFFEVLALTDAAYFGALTVTKAGLRTRSATV